MSVSCNITTCPSSIENLSECSENILQDWVIIDPSEDKIYYMNRGDTRKFMERFNIEYETDIEFSEPRLDFEQCSVNGVPFDLILHNFTSLMDGLIVMCGLQRFGNNVVSSYLIRAYAHLQWIQPGTL